MDNWQESALRQHAACIETPGAPSEIVMMLIDGAWCWGSHNSDANAIPTLSDAPNEHEEKKKAEGGSPGDARQGSTLQASQRGDNAI
jgi:hypothetical protein